MTPRPRAWTRRVALLTSAGGLLALAGCDPRALAYFIQPFEPKIEAPCPSLKGKKVVVITRAESAASQYEFAALDRELTREVVKLLRENVKRIEVVDPEKVSTWARGNPSWTDPADLARAFNADAVIDLEVAEFQIDSPSSPGLFEGHSHIRVRATEWAHPKDDRGREIKERPKEASELYHGDAETAFPVTGHVPVSADVSRTKFKNHFLKLVATEVSWHFIDHAPGDNIRDSRLE